MMVHTAHRKAGSLSSALMRSLVRNRRADYTVVVVCTVSSEIDVAAYVWTVDCIIASLHRCKNWEWLVDVGGNRVS